MPESSRIKLGTPMCTKIASWDGQLSIDSEIASFMQEMYFELTKIILQHYMGDRHLELIGEFIYHSNSSASLSYRLQGWLLYMLDAIESKKVKDFEITDVLDNSINKVASNYNTKNSHNKSWGQMHFLHIDLLLSKIKFI